MDLSASYPSPNPGGPSHNFGLCCPRELVKRLRSPPYTPLVGHTLSGFSAMTCLVWVTLAVATLPPASLEHAVLPSRLNLNFPGEEAPPAV